MLGFKVKQKRKILFDIILILLVNIGFFLSGGGQESIKLIQTYQLDKLIPSLLLLLVSFLYYFARRWRDSLKRLHLAEQRVSKDALTKLYNRRAFEPRLLSEWQRFLRYKEPFCLLMIHIDDLKLINKSFGYKEGDRIIIEIADKLKKSTRQSDFCARWSDSEFVILCPVSKLESTAILAERLRSDVYRLLPEGIELTISLGLGQSDLKESLENFLEKIELRVYKAKKTGGNTVAKE